MATSATASSVSAPGFQRMKATLGPTKAEALRQNVLDDQAKSMAASKTTKAKKAKIRRSPRRLTPARSRYWPKQIRTRRTAVAPVGSNNLRRE